MGAPQMSANGLPGNRIDAMRAGMTIKGLMSGLASGVGSVVDIDFLGLSRFAYTN
jgi:hypothetical protein